MLIAYSSTAAASSSQLLEHKQKLHRARAHLTNWHISIFDYEQFKAEDP